LEIEKEMNDIKTIKSSICSKIDQVLE